jgi:hypothetical protein
MLAPVFAWLVRSPRDLAADEDKMLARLNDKKAVRLTRKTGFVSLSL